MNRQEAIKILKIAKAEVEWEYPMDYQIALDLAISSLETDEAYQLEYEQPEFCADCISRAEVLKLMKDNWHTHNGDWAMQESMDDIRALPSVYPKSDKPIRSRWHGHWIDCDNSDDYSADGYDCSVCGVNAEYATSYCPNCGAKMVEEQTGENT